MTTTHEPTLTPTRRQILDALLRRSEVTVLDLAAELDIAAGSLRRHLDILAAEGYVTSRPVRRGQGGRPYYVYSPTETARESASRGYGKLVERLVLELASLPREQIGEADGSQLLQLVFDHMGEDLAKQYEPQVTAPTLEGRIDQVTRALAKEGVLDSWEPVPEGYRLTNCACPYRRAALATHGACASERRTIELLLGVPVKQVSRIVEGTPQCAYVVEAAAPA